MDHHRQEVAADNIEPSVAVGDVACVREAEELPEQGAMGKGLLRSIVGYGRKVYDLGKRLAGARDKREEPATSSEEVAAAIFFGGLLRIRSFNALEPKLREKTFLRLVGAAESRKKLGSADTLSRALRKMVIDSVRSITVGMLQQAERNKVFREGWLGALRYVAIDGWEPICSYNRHCKNCLVRMVEVRRKDGTTEKVPQYYHRYAVGPSHGARLGWDGTGRKRAEGRPGGGFAVLDGHDGKDRGWRGPQLRSVRAWKAGRTPFRRVLAGGGAGEPADRGTLGRPRQRG